MFIYYHRCLSFSTIQTKLLIPKHCNSIYEIEYEIFRIFMKCKFSVTFCDVCNCKPCTTLAEEIAQTSLFHYSKEYSRSEVYYSLYASNSTSWNAFNKSFHWLILNLIKNSWAGTKLSTGECNLRFFPISPFFHKMDTNF